jgi:uncharacterized caspase-like protein
LRDFANKIKQDKESIGLFYYAGHGIQAEGSNYLIPVDVSCTVQQFDFVLDQRFIPCRLSTT